MNIFISRHNENPQINTRSKKGSRKQKNKKGNNKKEKKSDTSKHNKKRRSQEKSSDEDYNEQTEHETEMYTDKGTDEYTREQDKLLEREMLDEERSQRFSRKKGNVNKQTSTSTTSKMSKSHQNELKWVKSLWDLKFEDVHFDFFIKKDLTTEEKDHINSIRSLFRANKTGNDIHYCIIFS